MKKILIAEDNENIRELISVTFTGLSGYDVMEVDSAEKAIEATKTYKPDLVLMDVMMPGPIDGIEATRIIKNDSDTSGIVIIILTAKGQKQDIEVGKEVGADDYIIKPFSPGELIRRIESVLT
ncbi:MAG: response regulator [Nitrospina sp.]|nr:response regulator [Nitrospina sp.]